MGVSRSSFDDIPVPSLPSDFLGQIGVICDELQCYGCRCIGAALRYQGVVVNSKKLLRLMREHGLQPKWRRRYVVTTDSDHDGPIFPDLAKNVLPARSNQPSLAAIVDAWSRRMVGYMPSAGPWTRAS